MVAALSNQINSYEMVTYVVQYLFWDAHPNPWRLTRSISSHNCPINEDIRPTDTPHIQFPRKWTKGSVYEPTSTSLFSSHHYVKIENTRHKEWDQWWADKTIATLRMVAALEYWAFYISWTTEQQCRKTHNMITRWKLWYKHWALILFFTVKKQAV